MVNKFDADEKLMRQAKFRALAKKFIRIHVIFYIVINLGLVAVWLLTTMGGYFWPAWSIAGWGLGLLSHGLITYIVFPGKRFNEKVQKEYQDLKNNEIAND